ncbi:MAG: alpha/beta hydrolase [Bacteroidota bacterium]
MNNKFTYFVLLSIFFISFSCSTDDPKVEHLEAVSYYDEAYGSDDLQKYNIHLPEGRDTKTPVIVLVHGGSWIGGDKNDMQFIIDEIKVILPEFAIANINYRLLTFTENKHPTQINDIESFIVDLESKSDDFQISDDYYFIGTSAGGHLSLLYTYTKNKNNDIKAVASIVGPTNFTDDAYVNSGNSDFDLLSFTFLGDSYQNNPGLYEDASPLFHVTSSSAPTILFYGGKDELIPVSQGIDLKDKLTEFGVRHEYIFYPEEGHGWEGENAVDTFIRITEFFREIHD